MAEKVQITIREQPQFKETPRLLISCLVATQFFFTLCPHAQTLEAYSKKLRCTVWIPLPCKQWKCRYCASQKIKKLAGKTRQAVPNRLLTLTVDPACWDSPRHAFDGTRRKVSQLIQKLRLKFGDVEYLRVTELTQRGWPHYHLLVRSKYLPHSVVKALWQDLTGATIVDLRQVHDTFQSYSYLVKYLSKMHEIEWTERHVSYSRNFFPPEPDPVSQDLDLQESSIIETHPGTLCYHQFRGAELVEISYGVFALNPDPDSFHPDPEALDYLKQQKEPPPCSTSSPKPSEPFSSSTQEKLFPTGSSDSNGKPSRKRPLHPN